jgi:hypothetical protein
MLPIWESTRLKYRLLKAKLVLYAAGMLHGTEVNNKLSWTSFFFSHNYVLWVKSSPWRGTWKPHHTSFLCLSLALVLSTNVLLKTRVVGFLVYVCAPQPKTSYLSWYFGVLLCYEDSKSWSIDYNQTFGIPTPLMTINRANIGKGSFSILAIKIVWVKEAIFKFTKQSLQPRSDG